jgi:hypothetical protein
VITTELSLSFFMAEKVVRLPASVQMG